MPDKQVIRRHPTPVKHFEILHLKIKLTERVWLLLQSCGHRHKLFAVVMLITMFPAEMLTASAV